MSRWQPETRRRLAEAALELYVERGYDATTVADIAAQAGLTERTFFRYYADKREVLFDGSTVLHDRLVSALEAQPLEVPPLAAVAAALRAVDGFFDDRPHSAQRQAVIDANPVLQERELIKLASLAGALTESLRARGVQQASATLSAEAGIAVFKVAFTRWVGGSGSRSYADLLDDAFAELHLAVGTWEVTGTTGGVVPVRRG